jgi:hypothetical protein
MPDIPIFTDIILSFATFVSLGFSIMFMSNTVERKVQNKKIPIFTYILLVAELLMLAGLLVPEMLLIVTYPWIAALLLAAFNVLATYIKVARITTGALKRQAISVLLYLTALYLSMALLRVLINPELFANALSSIFVIGLYNSLKSAREIRNIEEKNASVLSS